MQERTLILVNPAAGSGAGKRIHLRIGSLLQGPLSEYREQIDVALTDREGLVAQARKATRAYSSIIAVGGDGTASQIIRGLREGNRKTSFGLLPLGTGNDLARTFGTFPPMLPESREDISAALQSLIQGKVRPFDLLEMEGIGSFINYAGMGLDGAVLGGYLDFQKTRMYRSFRKVWSARFLLYALFLCRHLSYRLPPGVELRVGKERKLIHSGKTAPLKGVIVSNIPYYAGGFPLVPEADPSDGLFEVTLIDGALDILRILASRIFPFRRRPTGLRQIETDRFTWSAPPGVPFQCDGERSPSPLPLSVTVKVAGQIPVLLPLNNVL